MRLLAAVCLLTATLLTSVSCGDEPPTTPSHPQTNLTGTWRGPIDIGGVSPLMTWTLTHSGSAVTGPVLVALPTGAVVMNGTLTGTLSGNSLGYTIAVAPGGLPTQPACSGQIAGVTTVASTSTMNGTYTVATSTCTTGLTSGSFALTRQ